MSGNSVACGVAILLGYLIHYILSLGSYANKLNAKFDDLYERWKKLYLFGIFGLLSMLVPCVYASIFCWISLIVLAIYYCSALTSDDEKRKRYNHIFGLIYIGVLTVWWIGETANIFANV